jgi:hypothetical protein
LNQPATKENLMNHLAFAALTRRTSLAALGTTGLAALTSVPSTAKNKRNKNKKAKKKCQQQVAQCTAILEPECGDDPACLACCEFAGRCDYAGFITCLEESQSGGEQ